jgi:PAT family acetyl-CoA transporter-like MFS transporter 1
MGLFLNSIPLLFKKYLSYQEIGVILMCTMPYSFKVLWSPFVELYYLPSIGKRKTWVVGSQLTGCIILFYLATSIDKMLEAKDVYRLLAFLMFNTFIITCQDIAVDSWAVDMLAPENSSYGSSS